MDPKEKIARGQQLLAEALAILQQEEKGAEEIEKSEKLRAEGKALLAEAAAQLEIVQEAQAAVDMAQKAGVASPKRADEVQPLEDFGEYLVEVWKAGNPDYMRVPLHPALSRWKRDEGEPAHEAKFSGVNHWSEQKALAEGVGATGGFLVPTEFNATLQAFMHEKNPIRARATIVPMRRRAVQFPVLDQTGTAAGAPHQFGGIAAVWTEEAEQKDETDPAFRQLELVAHKLVCYTRASDELLDDSAVGLAAILTSQMGFVGAINWEEEFTFLQGTGAGQPLGVINAGATIVVARAAAGTIGVADIMNMVMAHQGDNPIWHISRSAMATLLQLNGPAANPSYIFIPNAREGMPATLMGFPIHWTEKTPVLGTQGDIVLADWTWYLVGDRQATTIESSIHERFRHDQTTWRAVHRVDGQPTLSTPLTLQDGATQISPFVILGDVAT